jgi:hypothetical protein
MSPRFEVFNGRGQVRDAVERIEDAHLRHPTLSLGASQRGSMP